MITQEELDAYYAGADQRNKKAQEALARDPLLVERQKTHGDFADHAMFTIALKDEMARSPNYLNAIPAHKEALDMIAHKIGRILAGNPNFHDHWDDIAGYAKLGSEACSK